MRTLKSYLGDRWQAGQSEGNKLLDPTTGEVIATTSTSGLDFSAALHHARTVGGPALRAMTFAERGAMLLKVSNEIHKHRTELLELSELNTGTTHSDSKFDIDGATVTLAAYAKIGESLSNRTTLLDGEGEQIGRSPRYHGQHIRVALRGVAVHINAFNFPAWGFAEKAACAWLAGMPVLCKPATATALPAYRICEILVESGILPKGAWSFLCGSVGDLLDHLDYQDVIAFTGSAQTGMKIRGHKNVLSKSIRVNVEADSLNAVVLGPDVERGSDCYDLFLRELAREMTQKSGQKCTATRRVIIPEGMTESVTEDLKSRLQDYTFGCPKEEGVRVGTLAAPEQVVQVAQGLAQLSTVCDLLLGEIPSPEATTPALVKPVLFLCKKPLTTPLVHQLEVFGPCATLLPYDGSAEEASKLVAMGCGGLVATVYSDDLDFTGVMLEEIAPYHGRVLLGSKRVAEFSTGPGLVLPTLTHGGPGRAGGGLELGGLRGLNLYQQTCAVQGARPVLDRVFGLAGGTAQGSSSASS
jgi:oxepin-CoA hydrolase/3-oxo-5,6-dehydrosuberyl-CoA semialdehyde dehydrogenase